MGCVLLRSYHVKGIDLDTDNQNKNECDQVQHGRLCSITICILKVR